MKLPTDNELLEDICSGNEKAMHEFYKRYSGIVYQFAFKTLLNGPDASEVMNEVMMEIWRKADSFSGKSKVRTWLLSITHNKAVDTVRRKSRHDGNEELDDDLDVASSCSLEDAQSGVENAKYIKQCMNNLNNSHRQVVYLTFFEGLSYPDIAGIMGIPAGTVKTRMMHAKKNLLNCLTRLFGNGAPV